MFSSAQVGFEPGTDPRLVASKVLSPGGLPVLYRAVVFSTQSRTALPIGVSRQRVAEVVPDGIEPSFPGCEPGVTTSSNCSASFCFINDTQHMSRFASSGRRIRTFTACFKGKRPTISRSPRVPCGSRPRLARLEAGSLCRSAKSTWLLSGRRGSRTLKA